MTCYDEGWQGFLNDIEESNYVEDSQEDMDWVDGWIDAYNYYKSKSYYIKPSAN